jgi:mycothione reductase
VKEYDVIVIGTGSGSLVTETAAGAGLRTGVIEKGPLVGGTCLNWGCIPSKQLIYVADTVVAAQEAGRLGVKVRVESVDFAAVMDRVRRSRTASEGKIRRAYQENPQVDFHFGEGRFTGPHTLEVNGETLRAGKIVIAAGSRPSVPPIQGLAETGYLTNETVLELTERPESLLIIGGGYIAVEFGHFFAAMGTRVTILEVADRLILSEEPEVAALLEKKLRRRLTVHTGVDIAGVAKDPGGVTVTAKDKKTGQQERYTASHLLVATGRRSNADLLHAEAAGLKLTARGFIEVNDRLETNVPGIWAVGDINGRPMFTHMANREAAYAARNVVQGTDLAVDFRVVPHAVYTHPQIASVGIREADAPAGREISVAVVRYGETAKGEAMLDEDSFVKIILDRESRDILGCHIIGPYAPELLQEVVNAMTSGGGPDEINQGIHIHPAMSEIIAMAVNSAA